MPGKRRSWVYLAAPVALAGPSRREMRCPMRRGCLGQETSTIRLVLFPSPPRLLLAGIGRLEHRLADAGVSAAAAEVTRQPLMDLVEARVGVPVEQGLGGHDEAGRAEAALLGVVLDEGRLERMELGGPAEPLDGLDGRPWASMASTEQA